MYATRSDMRSRFGAEELVQLTNKGATPITAQMLSDGIDGVDLSGYTQAEQDEIAAALAVLDRALDDAQAEIDPYLQGRYALPLSSTPTMLLKLAADMARFNLYENAPPEIVQTRYENAVQFLRGVSRGQVSLGLDAAEVAEPEAGGIATTGSAPVFTADNLKGYTT